MKNKNVIRIAILDCILSICLIGNYIKAKEDLSVKNNDYLTVRESLFPMFNDTFRMSNEFFPIHRINPEARQYIIFYLENDNSCAEYVAGGIWLLGVVGIEDDIDFVDSYIQSRLNSTNEEENRWIRLDGVGGAIGCFAGMMLKRDIEGAKQFCQKYGDVTAWMSSADIDDAKASRAYKNFIPAAYTYSKANFILPLLRKASSGTNPLLNESYIDYLENLETDKYTEMMKPGKTSEETLKKYRRDFLNDYGGVRVDILLNKQTLAQWREAQETVPKPEKKPVDSFESIDMSGTIQAAYLQVIASDAAEAYVQISGALLDRNARDLPIKKEILQDIQDAGLNNYDGFQVTLDVEAKIDKGTATGPVVLKDKVTAAVTFNIQGTADIFERHVPDAGDNSLISSTTGDVIINTKRIDDKWYWSPASDPNVSALADIVEDDYLIDSVHDATIAYTQITRMIIDGNYDPLVIPLLDNSKLIPLKKRKRQKDEMLEALEVEKKILEDLTRAKLNNYDDYHVKVKFEATLGNYLSVVNDNMANGGIRVETGAMPLAVKGYETADVTFIIRDTPGIFKKYIRHRLDDTTVDDETGNLKVYMKRINGKWYWNPFGW